MKSFLFFSKINIENIFWILLQRKLEIGGVLWKCSSYIEWIIYIYVYKYVNNIYINTQVNM